MATTSDNKYNELCHDIRNVSVNLAGICKKMAKCSRCSKYIVEITNLCNRMESKLKELVILNGQSNQGVIDGE